MKMPYYIDRDSYAEPAIINAVRSGTNTSEAQALLRHYRLHLIPQSKGYSISTRKP